MTTQTRIGWIGLGRMGEAMVKKLTAAGHGVQVWNRTRDKALPLADYGATIVDNKLDLAGCDIVFTMVSTTDDLKEVLFGDGGLVTGGTQAEAGDRQQLDLAGRLGRDPRAARGAGHRLPVRAGLGQRQGRQGRQAADRRLRPEERMYDAAEPLLRRWAAR